MTDLIVKKLDSSKQLSLFQNLEGACNKDGTFKRGWTPTVQSYVRRESEGVYTVVHNLNKLNYSLNVSLLSQPGSFKISDQNEVSFTLKTTLDRKPTDFEFKFSICVIGD